MILSEIRANTLSATPLFGINWESLRVHSSHGLWCKESCSPVIDLRWWGLIASKNAASVMQNGNHTLICSSQFTCSFTRAICAMTYYELLKVQVWQQQDSWQGWLLQLQGSRKAKAKFYLLFSILVYNMWLERNRMYLSRLRHKGSFVKLGYARLNLAMFWSLITH